MPLAAAACTLVVRGSTARRRLTLSAVTVHLAASVSALVATAGGRVIAVQVGGWPPGIAIPIVVDTFSALMLAVTGVVALTCLSFAFASSEDDRSFYHPLVLVLITGISGSFLTADLFNLFVFFEVMLIASYALVAIGATGDRLRAAAVYVTTNLFASTILLAGIALVYATAGTVNLAELNAVESGTMTGVGALLLVAFGLKASLVPLHGWIGLAYPAAPPAAAALFSGLLTKVGVYALYRTYSVAFAGEVALRGLLIAIACVTMVGGVLAAIGREDIRGILSFHITSQVGYMILGLGLFGPLGLAAGIFYILHHIIVKTSLFLAAGATETLEGTGELAGLGGLARRRPVLASGFAVAAFALVGVPPLSGFFAKLGLVGAAFADGYHVAGAVAIVVSFLTLVSMAKIWTGAFWGESPRVEPSPPRGAAIVAPAIALAGLAVVIGFGAEGLYRLSSTAAQGLTDVSGYVEAVLGR